MSLNATTLASTLTNGTSTQDVLIQSAGAITAAIVFSIIIILAIILALVVKFHKPSHGALMTSTSQSSRHTRSTTHAQHRVNGAAATSISTAAAASSRRHNGAAPSRHEGSASRYITPYGDPHRNGSLARPGGRLDGVVVTQRTQAGNWEPERWPRISLAVPAGGGAAVVSMDDLPTISRFDEPATGLLRAGHDGASWERNGSSVSTIGGVSLEMSTINSIEDLIPPDYPMD
ncbi:uncharacterized protein LOC133357092 [Lethenteron reissneri]|uniref:uncharacterized protein LOC133357092 n=1 Tax=Lethenteron reissneri TaxID=7753 RepID=UPI002AB5FDCC|nr:uncharacterized protein LOC133357092 [Lethenteron reissneri]XP_061430857.1 uncharacterized protein LOC133357092 [Lethenteron reissneri]